MAAQLHTDMKSLLISSTASGKDGKKLEAGPVNKSKQKVKENNVAFSCLGSEVEAQPVTVVAALHSH